MRPLHPDAEGLLSLIRASGRPPFEQLAPAEARVAYSAVRAALQPPPEPTAETQEHVIDGPGGALRLRAHRAVGTAADAVLPCLIYLHGGGWVLGDLDSHDGVCRRLANGGACCVVAVDYRLAPEHPFPAALDDAVAALAWAAEHSDTLRIDPRRIAVGGDSAGGNLAAVLALMGRDGLVPRPVFQLLFYPVVDLAMTSDGYRLITAGVPLTAGTMRYFVDHYLPHPSARHDWRASPLRAASLAGSAPALVVTVGQDPLCAEGRAYADRLESEGVRVTALHLSDHVHGLLTMGRVIAAADPILQFAGAALRDAWRLPAP
ncbi:MAG: alpha/beta hydrolase [Gemmatimonadaceae bacterium]|nr:alpha/beta hydrolase [Acetobacteraceae bacterium]